MYFEDINLNMTVDIAPAVTPITSMINLYIMYYWGVYFRKIMKKNDLKRIRFHDLRHSCAALLLSECRELYDVSEWLGHSDVNITAKFYGHLDMKRKKDLGNTIGNSIGFKNVV